MLVAFLMAFFSTLDVHWRDWKPGGGKRYLDSTSGHGQDLDRLMRTDGIGSQGEEEKLGRRDWKAGGRGEVR